MGIIGEFLTISQNQSTKRRRSHRQPRSTTDELLPQPSGRFRPAGPHTATRCELWRARYSPPCTHPLTITWLQWFCAFRAAGPSAPLHKETNCHDDYRDYHCDLNYIRQRQVLHLAGLFRQFDAVRVFVIALVFFSQNFFKPLRLPFCNPLIHRSRMVAYEKLLPASVTPERPHLLETQCFLPARLLDRHGHHLRAFLGRFTAVICCYALQRSAAHSHSGSCFP